MNQKPIRLFLFFLLLHFSVSAQFLSIQNAPVDTVDCNNPCYKVKANFPKTKLTTQYIVNPIPFNPIVLPSPSNLTLGDDKFSSIIPIGFTFCFYGQSYNSCCISSNGHITFNTNYANDSCSFDTKQTLPFFNSTFPDNAIFCPFIDGNTQVGGAIKYQTVGNAPNRKMIVSFEAIPIFGTNSVCTATNITCTFQCVLTETSNLIEIFITQKENCNADPNQWLNYGTLGIQNTNALSFLVAPGKNASIWTDNNKGYEFKPNGNNAYSINWYENGAIVGSNVDSISVCSPFPKSVKAVYTMVCPTVTEEDTILLIQQLPKIDSVKIIHTLCKNIPTGVITIFGSTPHPPLTYALDNNTFLLSSTFNNVSFGSHVVKIKDANGCEASQVVQVNANSTLKANIDSLKNPTCPLNNGKIWGSATGGTPPYTYSWSSGATGNPITNLTPGNYCFKVTDAAGCKDSMCVTLFLDSLPNILSIVTKPICGGTNGKIDVTPNPSTANYTYLWSNGATTQDLNNIAAGSYSVIVTDVNGCTSSFPYALIDTLNVTLTYATQHTKCGLSNGIVAVAASNGIAPYLYSWSNGSTTNIANNLPSGWVYVTVIDNNNCVKNDSVKINPSNGLSIQFITAEPNCDKPNGLINTVVTGNTGAVNYSWNTGATSQNLNNVGAGTYTVTTSDGIGCTKTSSLTLIDKGKPHLLVLSYTPPLCYGDSTATVTLSGVGGIAPYKYSFDNINFSTTATIGNLPAGILTIYIRDVNSCLTDTTVNFPQPDPLQILLSTPDTVICYEDKTGSVSFSCTTGKAPYTWNFNGTGFQATQTIFNNLGVGNYWVQVKDANGCTGSTTTTVEGPPLPLQVNFSNKNVGCYETNTGKINATITGGWLPVQYYWLDTNLNSLVRDKLPHGTYLMNVTDNKGCQLVAHTTVEQDYCCDCYFPNAFTPNSDNNNDVFRAITPSDVENYVLKIYDRWGNLVFVTQDFSQGWNGKINGKDADIATYYYYATYSCKYTDKKLFQKGDINLIR